MGHVHVSDPILDQSILWPIYRFMTLLIIFATTLRSVAQWHIFKTLRTKREFKFTAGAVVLIPPQKK